MSHKNHVIECDILIIGAGPGGSSAAIESSKAGLNVTVVERKEMIGKPVRCAGYIPALLLREFQMGNGFIIQAVDKMITVLPDGSTHELRAPGYLIDREIFDQRLSELAMEQGARYLMGARAIEMKNGMIRVKGRKGQIFHIRTKVIIGADGPYSKVASWMGIKNNDMVVAIQVRIPLVHPMEHTIIFFNEKYYAGYGWLFPRKNEANVGIGMKKIPGSKVTIFRLLKDLIDQLKKDNLVKGDPKNITAGWIPVNPIHNFVSRNIMLVGDAAGHTHPITGAGIYQAVSGGKMAGLTAIRAVRHNKMEILHEYQREFMAVFYDSFEKARKRRRLMETRWYNLDEIIRRCWIGFPDYHKDH